MKAPLSPFLMEDWLEQYRFSARYNAGESGHRPQTLSTLINGLQADFDFDLRAALEGVSLCDAPNMGFDDLRAEVARLHPGASVANVLITTGTSEALLLLLRTLKPQKVAVIVPAFQLLTEIPRSLGADVVPLPIRWSEHGIPQAPISEWLQLIEQSKPDLFIFNHPHNPSGLIFSETDRRLLYSACDAVGCVVLGDEHYRFLGDASSESRVRLGATVWRPDVRRFVTGSFIKCAGTPGLRIGWCVGEPEVLASMQSEKNYLTHTVNPMSQLLALWFLQSFQRSQSFFSKLHNDWMKNREQLRHWLASTNSWVGFVPEGGLVTCFFPKTEIEDENVSSVLKKHGVFLLPLSSFCEMAMADPRLSRGFRLGLGLLPEQFKSMLSVMEM